MVIKELIQELQEIAKTHGEDIKVQLQGDSGFTKSISDDTVDYMSYEHFFIVPEKYDEGTIVNIRSWPC